jgi:hypothetical protein
MPAYYSFLETWESIKFPPGHEKPPKAEFEAKLQALVDAQPLSKLREERNVLLDKTDKYTTPDYPHADEAAKQAWLDYRQVLRNLPSTATPTLDKDGNLGGFEWPVQPSP